MATYVIGDVQGCAESLEALLERCELTRTDRVWFVGDIVNRGPQSLEALELIMSLGERARVVLGNHDLHLLACHVGAQPGRGDTIQAILEAPRREELISWLRSRPLLYEEGGVAMTHAGINPAWSWSEVQSRAQRAHKRLMSDDGLEQLAIAHPSRAQRGQAPHERAEWIQDLAWFTRVRFIRDGQLDERCKGGPSDAGPDEQPWYELYEDSLSRGDRPERLIVGHWAALGLRLSSRLASLDTGCIWGRYLTALRLEDDALFMQSTIERALTPQHQRPHPAQRS